LILKKLTLSKFRNYDALSLEPGLGLNILFGQNGAGKTNVLDAINFLSMGKSAFGIQDVYCYKVGSDYFRIQGEFSEGEKGLALTLKSHQSSKKILEINGQPVKRIADHIGNIPIIVSGPSDIEMISGSPEVRRNFLDQTLSQFDPEYLSELMKYNKILKQKNAELKRMKMEGKNDLEMIQTYHEQLSPLNLAIFQKRKTHLLEGKQLATTFYQRISSGKEKVSLKYLSQVHERSPDKYGKEGLRMDLSSQRSLYGIHKDDIEFLIDGRPAKKFASQGQQKSIVAGARLMQRQLLNEHGKKEPLIILDDIFDRLDPERAKNLVELLLEKDFGQTFISDAQPSRSKGIFGSSSRKIDYFEVKKGGVSKK
jgi:DNA replication and repair protein RecF